MSKITPLGQFTLFKLRTGPQHVKWSLATQKYQPMKIRGFLQWLLWLVVGPQSIFTEWPSIVDKYFSVGKHRHRSIKKIYINSNNNTRALLYGKLFKVPGGEKHRADWESAERKMFGSNPLENGLEKIPATSLLIYTSGLQITYKMWIKHYNSWESHKHKFFGGYKHVQIDQGVWSYMIF